MSMVWSGYEAGRALVPRAIDTPMSQTVALKASLVVTGVRTRERCVNEFSMDGTSGLYFVHKFGPLDDHEFVG